LLWRRLNCAGGPLFYSRLAATRAAITTTVAVIAGIVWPNTILTWLRWRRSANGTLVVATLIIAPTLIAGIAAPARAFVRATAVLFGPSYRLISGTLILATSLVVMTAPALIVAALIMAPLIVSSLIIAAVSASAAATLPVITLV
jgi:hypothetical protein